MWGREGRVPNKWPLPASGHCVLGQITASYLVSNLASGFLWFSLSGFLGCSKPHTILLTLQERLLISFSLQFSLLSLLLLYTPFHACSSSKSTGFSQEGVISLSPARRSAVRETCSYFHQSCAFSGEQRMSHFAEKKWHPLVFLHVTLIWRPLLNIATLFSIFSGAVVYCSVYVSISHHCLRKKKKPSNPPLPLLLYILLSSHLSWCTYPYS